MAKRLTDIEWTTCWMAIRYAMNRQTIASSMLPCDLIRAYWPRWTDHQKQEIANDLALSKGGFGNEHIDKPIWMKFVMACDTKTHRQVKLVDGTICSVFEANGRIYPLNHYVNQPHAEIFLPPENIAEYI